MSGVSSPGQPPEYTCISGNCFWPSLESLGMCLNCEDVLADTKIQCDKPQSVDGQAYMNTCNYTFPSGFVTKTIVTAGTVGNPQSAYSNDVYMNTSVSMSATNRSVFAEFSGIIFRGMVDLPDGIDLATTDWTRLLRPKASQCTLTWCAQTYAASNSSKNRIHDIPTSSRTSMPLMNSCYQIAGSSMRCAWYPSEESPPSMEAVNASKLAGPESEIHWLNQQVIRMLFNDFQGAFDFSIQMINSSYRLTPIDRIMYSSNISAPVVLSDVATSLSNHMREAVNSTVVKGTVVAPVTHVKVNWPWLACLGLLVVLAAAFLAWAIAFSFTHRVVIWKSSSLPLLFTDLSGWDKQHDVPVEDLGGMKRIAKSMKAHLADDVDGSVALVKTDQ